MRKRFSSAIIACSVVLMAYGCSHEFNRGNEHSSNEHAGAYNSASKELLSVSLDPVADCAIEHEHQHDGEYYAGHYNNDLHGHHGLQADNICSFANCAKTSLHEHDGVHFAGHHDSDSHDHKGNHGNHGYGEH